MKNFLYSGTRKFPRRNSKFEIIPLSVCIEKMCNEKWRRKMSVSVFPAL